MTPTQRRDTEREQRLMPAPKNRSPLPYLRAWRLHADLTQHELAAKSNVSHATIARAETGSMVSGLTATRLGRALGVSVRQLQEEEPPQP
jgi:transcriptional regulator with XRE-family HTH domain